MTTEYDTNKSNGIYNTGFNDENIPVRFGLPELQSVQSLSDRKQNDIEKYECSSTSYQNELDVLPGQNGTSIKNEARHFCGTTTMHGPKRIFFGKGWAFPFWAIAVFLSLSALFLQTYILTSGYLSKPIRSQVTFLLNDEGQEFPQITFCNLNPIKNSYIVNGDEELNTYVAKHPNFTADSFFQAAGFECDDVFRVCTFQGQMFDCCKYATWSLTALGKCWTLNIAKSDKTWMQKQIDEGMESGLKIILDAQLNDQYTVTDTDDASAVFTNAFTDGFRYYVHPQETIPNLASDEMTVSPNSVAFSGITADRFILLPPDKWGNCSDKYPKDISTDLPYSSANCEYLCKAKYFMDQCGCSPSIYNLDGKFPECTPYETYMCMNHKMENEEGIIKFPPCSNCKTECNSLVYRTFSSYGSGFSKAALDYFQKKNGNWTPEHVQENFQVVNLYFRDMSYTEYSQVQDDSITQLLSNIGGNMGMFLGMSVITITEISMFFSKVIWITISRTRRDYMSNKQQKELAMSKTVDDLKKFQADYLRDKDVSRSRIESLDPNDLVSIPRRV